MMKNNPSVVGDFNVCRSQSSRVKLGNDTGVVRKVSCLCGFSFHFIQKVEKN